MKNVNKYGQSAAKIPFKLIKEEGSTTISKESRFNLINYSETGGYSLKEWRIIHPSTSGIYCIVNNKNDKFYVGISKNIRKRIKEHYNLMCNQKMKGTSKLKNAFIKYDNDNFKFMIIELSSVDLKQKEAYYIDCLDSVNNGYNIKRYDENYKETFKQTQETIDKVILMNSKPILVFDLNGNFIEKCLNANTASKQYNLNRRTLSQCCENNLKVILENKTYFYTCGGYIFIKEKDYDGRKVVFKSVKERNISYTPLVAIEKCKKKCVIYNLLSKEKLYFDSIKEMLISLNIKHSTYYLHRKNIDYLYNNTYTFKII